jgi:hypothetical protein
MNTELDLKKLWQQQPVDEKPDIKELLRKANKLTKIARYKLVGLNLALLATVGVWIWVLYNMQHRNATTLIGMALMALGVFIYLGAYNQMIPIVFKSNPQNTTQQYLVQLITIKRKEDFLHKVMSNIYFALLTGGLALYLIQPVQKMSVRAGIFFCAITFSCMGFAWFYLRPLGERRRQKNLHAIIEKLELINEQLTEKK